MESKNNNPFKVPNGYFETLEKKLLEKTKTNYNAYGFKTPKGYFDQLERNILVKTIPQKVLNNKTLKRILFGISSVAASLLLYYNITNSNDPLVADNGGQAFEEYLENYYLEDLNSYEILSMLDDTEIETSFTYISKP